MNDDKRKFTLTVSFWIKMFDHCEVAFPSSICVIEFSVIWGENCSRHCLASGWCFRLLTFIFSVMLHNIFCLTEQLIILIFIFH